MSKKIVFTIVAKNYVGLAGVLGQSVLRNSPDTEFYIVIADDAAKPLVFDNKNIKCLTAKHSLEIPKTTWNEMAFKYNVTEFCTSIKPFCFSYFFKLYDDAKIIFLDPDILVFSSLNEVWDLLSSKTAIITPHFVTAEKEYSGPGRELNVMINGIYNLGFIALKNNASSIKIVDWWKSRLVKFCFAEKMDGLYTDQKWINFLPVFLSSEELEISRNIGLNVAPWNFYERKIIKEQGLWFVSNRIEPSKKQKLIFVHYSGFDYKRLTKTTSHNKNIPNLTIYEDTEAVFDEYRKLLENSEILKYLAETYSYNIFDNGDIIVSFHRRLYRRLIEDGVLLPNPFETSTQNSFYALLKKSNLVIKRKAGTSIDQLNDQNFEGFGKKLHSLNLYHKILKRILGTERYLLFSRFMPRYHRPENQVFLLMEHYMQTSYKIEYC